MLKKIKVFFFIAVLCFCGTASAGTMEIKNGELDFLLECNEPVLLPGSSDNSDNEVVTIEFKLKFKGATIPTEDITYIETAFTYDADKFTFISAEPGPGWMDEFDEGSVDCAEPDYCGNGYAKLRFNGYDGTPSGDFVTYAYIKLEPKCQYSGRVTGYLFFNLDGTADNGLSCGNDWYNADMPAWGPHTYISLYDTDFHIDPENTAVGLMGDKVLVPVYFQQDTDLHRLDSVIHLIDFDDTKLALVGVFPNNDAFDIYGYATTQGTCPIEITIRDLTNSYIEQPAEESVPVKLYDIEFRILGQNDGPGNSIPVEFESMDHTVWTVWNENNGDGCDEINTILYYNNSTDGDIDIPLYSAEMIFTTTDLYLDKGDVVTYTAEIECDFPIGEYDDGLTYGAIENVLQIPDFLTAGSITDQSGLDFGGGALQNGVRIFQAKQSYNSSWASFVHSDGAFTDMYTTTFFTMPGFEPDYNDRLVGFTWLNTASVGGVDYYTLVTDTTGFETQTPTDLTLSADGFEIHMGQFHTPYSTDGDMSVSQPLWVASNFDAADFSLHVHVSGNAKISSVVSNMTGVVANKTSSYDADFYWDGVGAFFDHPGYDDSVQIATINYTMYHSAQAGKVARLDGPGTGSHYVYGYVTFSNAWIEDGAAVDHYLELDPHNVRGYCNHEPVINDGITKDNSGGIPVDFALHENHPNPFNPTTILSYDVPATQQVLIEVYNILGQQIKTLVDEIKSPGTYEAEWNGTDESGYRVASGIYLYHMQSGQFSQSKKMMLMK